LTFVRTYLSYQQYEATLYSDSLTVRQLQLVTE